MRVRDFFLGTELCLVGIVARLFQGANALPNDGVHYEIECVELLIGVYVGVIGCM